jgi:hypothetical protein
MADQSGGGSSAAAGSAAAGATTTTSGGGAADHPSSAPLPNPWAPAGGAAAGGAPAGGNPADLLRSLQGLGGAGGGAAGAGGFGDLLGGLGGAAGGSAGMAEMTARMLENPGMRDSMIAMMSQPGMLDMIAASNPQLNQMLSAAPGIRDLMASPEMLRMMLSPDMLRMASQFGGGAPGGLVSVQGGWLHGWGGERRLRVPPARWPHLTHCLVRAACIANNPRLAGVERLAAAAARGASPTPPCSPACCLARAAAVRVVARAVQLAGQVLRA